MRLTSGTKAQARCGYSLEVAEPERFPVKSLYMGPSLKVLHVSDYDLLRRVLGRVCSLQGFTQLHGRHFRS
jgi:hypothetical protein